MKRKPVSIVTLLLFSACLSESKPERPQVRQRFAAVAKKKTPEKPSALCEVSFDSSATAPTFTLPPSRPLPAETKSLQSSGSAKSWRWINIWASWCGPCVEEFPLLARWQKALAKEKIDLAFEFWSMDEEGENLVKSLQTLGGLPGSIHWFRSPDDVPSFFKGLGIEAMSPIPVHVLVDEKGKTRCIRVGKIGEDLYGSLRQFLSNR
jgi:thiol-disulfide isomerase/thioredoxin